MVAGARGRAMRSYCLMGTASARDDEKVLEMDSGDH